MKTISLWQPWASAIAIGVKTIETRGWWTAYRGELAIHAAKKDSQDIREFFSWEVCDPIRAAGYRRFEDLPFGAIVATCRLAECLRTTDVDCLSSQERNFGDYAPGRYALVLTNIVRINPIPFRGAQGFFNWPPLVENAADRLPGL